VRRIHSRERENRRKIQGAGPPPLVIDVEIPSSCVGALQVQIGSRNCHPRHLRQTVIVIPNRRDRVQVAALLVTNARLIEQGSAVERIIESEIVADDSRLAEEAVVVHEVQS
jgi:hypothetical protein